MIELFPSILSSNFIFLKNNIKKLEKADINCLHLDIMDGHFVDNITIGPDIVNSISENTNLKLDIHLMLSNPLKYIERFINKNVINLTFHFEIQNDIFKLINLIKKHNCKVCIAINPETNIENIFKYIEYIDMILIMTVTPGFGNQLLNNNCIKKIIKLKNFIVKNKTKCKIQIDGGINDNNIETIINAGADIIVIGSSIFNNDVIKSTKKFLKKINILNEKRYILL